MLPKSGRLRRVASGRGCVKTQPKIIIGDIRPGISSHKRLLLSRVQYRNMKCPLCQEANQFVPVISRIQLILMICVNPQTSI